MTAGDGAAGDLLRRTILGMTAQEAGYADLQGWIDASRLAGEMGLAAPAAALADMAALLRGFARAPEAPASSGEAAIDPAIDDLARLMREFPQPPMPDVAIDDFTLRALFEDAPAPAWPPAVPARPAIADLAALRGLLADTDAASLPMLEGLLAELRAGLVDAAAIDPVRADRRGARRSGGGDGRGGTAAVPARQSPPRLRARRIGRAAARRGAGPGRDARPLFRKGPLPAA